MTTTKHTGPLLSRMVQCRASGLTAPVLRLEDNGTTYIVEVDGEERRWGRDGVRIIAATHASRGIAKASARDAEVARLVAEGGDRKAVAAALGLTPWQVTAALKRAREAEYDARCVKALAGRRGFVSLRTAAEVLVVAALAAFVAWVIAADVFEECVTPEGEVHECRGAP
jgi:DNA-binding CsgD family transcriptional regulator